jgi:hypothetical protein
MLHAIMADVTIEIGIDRTLPVWFNVYMDTDRRGAEKMTEQETTQCPKCYWPLILTYDDEVGRETSRIYGPRFADCTNPSCDYDEVRY